MTAVIHVAATPITIPTTIPTAVTVNRKTAQRYFLLHFHILSVLLLYNYSV